MKTGTPSAHGVLFSSFAVVFGMACRSWAQTTLPSDTPLRRGGDLLAEGKVEEARREFQRVLTESSSLPQERSIAQLRVAQTYRRAKDLRSAEREYGRVVTMKDAPAHHVAEAQGCIEAIHRLNAGLPARDPVASRTRLPELPKPGIELHVAPGGADTNVGTTERPFRSLERARNEIRAIKKRGGLPLGGAAVVVSGGRYGISRTFCLTAEDSGSETSPVVYRAADRETPVFSGGVRLSGWVRVQDPNVLSRVPETARGKLYQADLKALGIGSLPPVRLGGSYSGLGSGSHPVVELFFDGRAMTLARWPNEGFLKVVETRGQTPCEGYLGKGFKEGFLVYEGDRPQRWTQDRDAVLYGYWYYDWADSYERVSSIDTAKRLITLAPPFSVYGYRPGSRYYALNLLSEIDMPGEWYLDRTSKVLYFYAPSDPSRAVIELSTAAFPLMEISGASHLRLQGLTWELGCTDGIILRGGDHCSIAGCEVRRCGGNGIEIAGGTDHWVMSCEVHSMGRGGIGIQGGDRKTLTPAHHRVENCHIYELSRVDHTYTPAVRMSGVGNRIAHNLMHDIGSSAINLVGNEHVVEFNEIARVVLESDDQGGVDMFGDPTYRGNVYRFNYFHHIGNWRRPQEGPACGQGGIRLDDAISGVLVYGNVFRRCAAGKLGFGGVQIHGGKDNILDGNVFLECATAVSFSPWDAKRWQTHSSKALASAEIDRGLYLQRYPDLTKLEQEANVNHLWRNLAVNCGVFLRRNQGGERLLDNRVIQNDSAISGVASDLSQLQSALGSVDRTGIEPPPLEEIGLYRDAFRRELPIAKILEIRSGR